MTIAQKPLKCDPVVKCDMLSDSCIFNYQDLDSISFKNSNMPSEFEELSVCNNKGIINNEIWLAFQVPTSKYNIQICPSNCELIPGGFIGVQAAIYSQCLPYQQYLVACESVCQAGCFTISSEHFIPGVTYYLMIDGCAGDVCDIQINCIDCIIANQPPQQVTGITLLDTVCVSNTVSISVSNIEGLVKYQWKQDGIILPDNSAHIKTIFSTIGIHQVCVEPYKDLAPLNTPPGPFCKSVYVKDSPGPFPVVYIKDIKKCAGDVFTFYGMEYKNAGTFEQIVLDTMFGCERKYFLEIIDVPLSYNDSLYLMCSSSNSKGLSFTGCPYVYVKPSVNIDLPSCIAGDRYTIQPLKLEPSIAGFVKKNKFGVVSFYIVPSISSALVCNQAALFSNAIFDILVWDITQSKYVLFFEDAKAGVPIRLNDNQQGLYCVTLKRVLYKNVEYYVDCLPTACIPFNGINIPHTELESNNHLNDSNLSQDQSELYQILDLMGRSIWEGSSWIEMQEKIEQLPPSIFLCSVSWAGEVPLVWKMVGGTSMQKQ